MATSTAPTRTTHPLSDVHDFDFLPGEWRIHHRRLKERLLHPQEATHRWVRPT
jgi:hypothetical protein